jgi:hypothetical protein
VVISVPYTTYLGGRKRFVLDLILAVVGYKYRSLIDCRLLLLNAVGPVSGQKQFSAGSLL